MKNLIAATALMLLAAPTAVLAQSAFDGTWKIDTAKVQASAKPFTSVLKNGVYSCETCVPPYGFKADGKFHPVKGHPDFDMEAVDVVNARTLRYTDKKDGKLVGNGTVTVSADGKTLSQDFTEITTGGPISGKTTAVRVARAPAGAHATSSSWRTQGYSDVSDKLLINTYRVDGNTLHMSKGTGESFDATMDGSDAPFHGSDSLTSIAVTRIGPRELRMVGKYQGKPVSRQTLTVSPDGRTMHIVSHNLRNDTTMRFVADKQADTSTASGGGTASATAPDGKPVAGTYASSANGRTTMITFAEDGTYTSRENGKVGETGTWTRDGDGKVCLSPKGEATRCFHDSKPAADSTWKATRIGHPDEVYTIRRKD